MNDIKFSKSESMIKNKLAKIYSKYLDNDKLDNMEKHIIKKFKKYEYNGRTIRLYYKNNIFIKIDERKTDQQSYILNETSLTLGKFPKEIIMIYFLRKILPDNIIKIKKYYFNSNKQILIMNKTDLTLDEFINTHIKNEQYYKTINLIFVQIFLLFAILQSYFNFIHNDLSPKNILLQPINDNEYIIYVLSNKTYKLKCEYIPILIDFATSGIHKIGDKKFSIYDTESLKNKNAYVNKTNETLLINNKKYRWYLLDNNIYDPLFDMYYLINHIPSNIPVIHDYKKKNNLLIDFINESIIFKHYLVDDCK
jgi:serine/threonine protein kinase